LEEFREKFTPFENSLIELVYKQGLNFAQAAKQLNPPVSREWVRIRHDELIKKIRRLYRSKGVTSA
jgi:hypothetical protein